MSRSLSFSQIEAFQAVVVSGTTVAAARMLNTTQPSISRQLAQAQSRTGLKLFAKDRGRLRLTPEGQHLYESVSLNFRGLDEIEKTVISIRESGTGIFRIASTPSLAQSVLPNALKVFSHAHPNVYFQVKTLSSVGIKEGLRLGMFDLAISNRPYEGEEFAMERIDQRQAVCVMHPAHPFATRTNLRVEDLAGEALIRLAMDDPLEVALNKALSAARVTVRSVVETIFSSSVCAFAAQGLGIAIVNPYVVPFFGASLVSKRFRPLIPVTTYIATSPFVVSPALLDPFVKILKKEVRRELLNSGLMAADRVTVFS